MERTWDSVLKLVDLEYQPPPGVRVVTEGGRNGELWTDLPTRFRRLSSQGLVDCALPMSNQLLEDPNDHLRGRT